MEQLENVTDLDLAAIEQLAVDCAQACVDVDELRRELHDARVALDEQRRMTKSNFKTLGYALDASANLRKNNMRLREACKAALKFSFDAQYKGRMLYDDFWQMDGFDVRDKLDAALDATEADG